MNKNILCLTFVAGLAFTACTGQISGRVFLDKNGNNIKDSDEPALGKVAYIVTYEKWNSSTKAFTNAKELKNDLTADDGTFIIPKEDEGDYCVNIKAAASSYFNAETQPTVTMPASKAVTTEATADTETEETDTENKDDDKDTEKKETKKKKEPPTPPPSLAAASSLKNCIRISNFASTDTLDVPVSLDYEKSMAPVLDVSSDEPKEYAAGETFEILIFYPRLCKILDLKVPQQLAAINQKPGAAMLALSQFTPDVSKAIKPYSLTEDVLVPVAVQLKALPNPAKDEEIVKIFPKAICPNDATINLEEHTFKIKKIRSLQILQDIKGSVEFGKALTLSTDVKNNSVSDFSDGATLVITLPEYVSINTLPSKCRNLVQQIQCDIENVEAHDSTSFSVTFKLPEEADIDENYITQIETELKFLDESAPIQATDIPISIPKVLLPPQ
jgi:hypothetical protein